MRILHAHWQPPASPADDGAVIIWAETGKAREPVETSQIDKDVPRHPFDVPLAGVVSLLEELLPDVPESYTPAWVRLQFPGTERGPQPSPHLVYEWEQDAPASFRQWLVSGLAFSVRDAFALFASLPLPEQLPRTIAPGNDLAYWQTVTNLGLEAVAQQKVLPVLLEADDDVYARWLPVLDGPDDGPRLAHLERAMPALCRAETDIPEEAPAPRVLLDTFLNALTDTLVRDWCAPMAPTVLNGEPAYQWLRQLFQPTASVVTGSRAQLTHLRTSYRAWLRNLHIAGDKTFRVALRLEAPAQQVDAPDATQWQLHFLLQARDDPSLLVTADKVWGATGGVLRTLDRRFEQPQEKLLAGLGYAARLFEPLKRGLEPARPAGVALTTDEAFEFLRQCAPLLEESGFGVLVPPWWNKPGSRLGVRLKLSSGSSLSSADVVSTGHLTLENLVSYEWRLSLGETELSRDEFDALVALKSPLVQIRGQWVQLDPEQIEKAIQFWEEHGLEGDVHLQEALQMGLGAQDSFDGLPVEEVQFEGWLRDWMDRFAGNEALENLPEPDGLEATLRPYQRYGYSWLEFLRQWGLGACLADDMGLGKTVQVLALLLRHKEERGGLPGPVLVVCPTSVVTNWNKEAQRFTPDLSTYIHHGYDRVRDDEFVEHAGAVDVILTSYATGRRDVEFLREVDWFGVVLDEAQNIKNPDTKQARAVRSLEAGFRFALTGTPVENRLSELWSIMHFLNPGYLGSRRQFRKQFAIPIERYGDEAALGTLRKLTSPFILRRLKTDPTVITDLPEKVETRVYCTLTEEQATLYESVVQQAMRHIDESDDMQRRGQVLSMLMQLKQICNHPAQFLHQIDSDYSPNGDEKRSGKLGRLTEMIDEILSVDDRMLIFTQFAEMGHLLKGFLQHRMGVPALFLYGATPARKRTEMIERFQEDPEGPPIFILSLKAGGTGLNLTRATHVFHFDRWWNPAVENQATDRAFRIGQDRKVQVHKFVCVGTLEERIDDMIEEKKALAESVIEGGEGWMTELSTDELRDLVTLRREMIG